MLSWMSLEDMTLDMPLDHLVLVQLQLQQLHQPQQRLFVSYLLVYFLKCLFCGGTFYHAIKLKIK